jgi:osmotically-inducible protein OsmY
MPAANAWLQAIRRMRPVPAVAAILAALASTMPVAGCIPVIVGAAAGGAALVATDRRSTVAQMEDEEIELKFAAAVANRYGDGVHAISTSYNGIVLLTGQVPDAATRDDVERIARGLEHVRVVQNELAIGPNTTLAERSRDTYTTSLVKARFVENGGIPVTQIKVVTERDTVYLMGIASHAEADPAAMVASTTSNVARVVKVFEYTD